MREHENKMNITLINATDTMNNYDDAEPMKDDAGAAGGITSGSGGGAGWFRFLRKNGSSNNVTSLASQQQQQQQATPRRNSKKVGPRRHTSIGMSKPSSSSLEEVERKQKQQQQQQRSSSMIITRPNNPYIRRPSIPTSIYPLELEVEGCCTMDTNMEDGDDDDDDDNSRDSYISECTMMTYSEERAEMVKKAFFQKIRDSKIDILQLSMEQKEALLRQVQEEQDDKFKREKKEKRKKILERYGYWPEDELDVDGEVVFDSITTPPTPHRQQKKVGLFGPLKQSFGSIVSLPPPPRNNQDYRGNKNSQRRNRSWTSTSTSRNPNEKENRNNREMVDAEAGHEDTMEGAFPQEARVTTTTTTTTTTLHHHPNGDGIAWPQQEESKESWAVEAEAAAEEVLSGSNKHRSCIDDIIELKLLVANQQATIDTLSSKLHNLQLANRQQQRTAEQQSSSRSLDLEERNRDLSNQLAECREREMSLRKELNSQFKNARYSDDDSNREQQHAALERRNVELERENEELRRALGELRDNGGGGTTTIVRDRPGNAAGVGDGSDGNNVRIKTPPGSDHDVDSIRTGGSRRSSATTMSTAISSTDGDGGSIIVRTL